MVYLTPEFTGKPIEIQPYAQLVDKRPFYQPFLEIYYQSFLSEKAKLNHISGIGYRKALEFLIKDYSISLNPEDSENIKKMSLSKVIEGYHSGNISLSQIAKRATWLGNDETHYVRKWPEKDVSNLKEAILLTLYAIEHAEMHKDVMNEMPEPK